MRQNLKSRYVFVAILLLFSVSLSAQKEVRQNVRNGNKAYKQEKYSEASKFYNDALTENPASPEANFNVGSTLYRQKQWDKSVGSYKTFLEVEKENPVKISAAWHNIGNALLQKKELQQSMEAYKMALRLNPSDEDARYNLAVVQKMIQDQQQENQQNQQQQQQDQDRQNQPQNNEEDKQQKPEEPNQPEQMSRDNARQLLQAIEQDERETQEKVNKIKAEERKQKAEENRRRNKDW